MLTHAALTPGEAELTASRTGARSAAVEDSQVRPGAVPKSDHAGDVASQRRGPDETSLQLDVPPPCPHQRTSRRRILPQFDRRLPRDRLLGLGALRCVDMLIVTSREQLRICRRLCRRLSNTYSVANSRRLFLGLTMMALLAGCSADAGQAPPGARVGSYVSPNPGSVNTLWLFVPGGLIVIDSGRNVSGGGVRRRR